MPVTKTAEHFGSGTLFEQTINHLKLAKMVKTFAIQFPINVTE